jgi:hypothetical protein
MPNATPKVDLSKSDASTDMQHASQPVARVDGSSTRAQPCGHVFQDAHECKRSRQRSIVHDEGAARKPLSPDRQKGHSAGLLTEVRSSKLLAQLPQTV